MGPIRIASAALGLLLAVPLAPVTALARDLFTGAISIDGAPAVQVGTNRARNIPKLFSESTLLQIDPGYLPTDPVVTTLDLRGLQATAGFDALSTTLRFQVPGAGIDVSFTGADRDAAEQAFRDWLEGDFSSLLAPGEATTRLLQALVEHSPVDPVAGNPNSLESRMFAADYRMGTAGSLAGYGEGGLFDLQLGGGYTRSDGFDVYAIDVPFHFDVGLGEHFALLLDLPLTFTSTQGAWSGMASGGMGLRISPLPGWSLTPAARIGGVGSADVGALAVMYSGTLTSHVRIPLGPFAIGLGNMGGIAKTLNGIEVSGLALDYDLTNWVTRNGLYLEGDFGAEALGTGLGWRVHGSDVRFFGDELYLSSYAEVGAAVAAGLPFGGLQVDLSYLFGRNTQGVSARLGLAF